MRGKRINGIYIAALPCCVWWSRRSRILRIVSLEDDTVFSLFSIFERSRPLHTNVEDCTYINKTHFNTNWCHLNSNAAARITSCFLNAFPTKANALILPHHFSAHYKHPQSRTNGETFCYNKMLQPASHTKDSPFRAVHPASNEPLSRDPTANSHCCPKTVYN